MRPRNQKSTLPTITWTLQPKPSDSSKIREWPKGSVNGHPAYSLHTSPPTGFSPKIAASGEHPPLILYVAQYTNNYTSMGWSQLLTPMTLKTMKQAYDYAQEHLRRNPRMFPPVVLQTKDVPNRFMFNSEYLSDE